MTDDNHEFTTESSPGEQAFESTVDDAVAFFETAFAAAENWYGPRASGVLRSCVRAALDAAGTASPETVVCAARTLNERDGLASNEAVESVLRRLEAMINESGGTTASDAGGI
jgi:hypothetical protein